MTSLGLNIKIPKQSIIKLHQLQNQTLMVKFNGGRQIYGSLKSWDKSMNLVLMNTEQVTGVENGKQVTRHLGLVIVKGSQIQAVCLRDGYQVIGNPFQEGDGDGEEGEREGEGEGQQQQISQKKEVKKEVKEEKEEDKQKQQKSQAIKKQKHKQ